MVNNYEQLVKALRLCQFGECGCGKCYYKELKGDWCTEDNHPEFFDCDDKLKLDAADAIEALRKRLVSALTALHLANEKMGYYGIQPYTEADGDDMISDWVKTLVHEELEQQLPKRGVWIWDDKRCIYVCSVCGSPKVRENMDRQIIKEQAYCYSCGAKMEAQDDKA